MTLIGKVLSGHPIVTSPGNTIRVVSFLKFFERKIRELIQSFHLYPGQAGDDGMHVLVVRKTEDFEGFEKYMREKVWELIGSAEAKGLSGLG